MEVEKVWSDGRLHAGDTVTMTLYKSHVAPDGTGTPYGSTVNVGSWQDESGTSKTGPESGSITVTYTPEGESTPVATLTLNSGNNWTASTAADALKKGTQYTVAWSVDGTDVTGVTNASLDGTNISLVGVVPPPTNRVTIKYQANGNHQNPDGSWSDGQYIASLCSENVVNDTVMVYIHWYNNVVDYQTKYNTVTLTADGITSTRGEIYTDTNLWHYVLPFTVQGITSDMDLMLDWGEMGQGISAVISDGSSGSYTSASPITLYQGNSSDVAIPADDLLTSVESVILTSAKWSHTWAALPVSDENGSLYYYVKENGHTGDTVTSSIDTNYEFNDAEPKAITKVIITNNVKGGQLYVTKSATFAPATNAYAEKTYAFTVKDADTGKYLQNTSGTLGDAKKWFTVKSGSTVTFPNLPIGTYLVEEDVAGATISGYVLTASGSGDVTVNATTPVTATLTNDYRKEYGSITVNKAALLKVGNQTVADSEASGQTVTIGLFNSVPTATSTTPNTETITLDNTATGSVQWTDLELGQTYYVYELDANGHPALLTGGQSSINTLVYTVEQDATSANLSTTAKSATISVTNTREEFTQIAAKKTWNGADDWKTGMSVTLQIKQYKGSEEQTGFTTATATNTNDTSVTISSQQTVDWTNLPKYYLDGSNNVQVYTYKVYETAVLYNNVALATDYRTVYTVTGEGAGTSGLVTINNADQTVNVDRYLYFQKE